MLNMNPTMNQTDYYILVDLEKKIVISKIQKLPQNWNNICGLPGYTDDELKKLDWAGHKTLGWINLSSGDIDEFSMSPENLSLNKNTFKDIISTSRKSKQDEPIVYKNRKVYPKIKTLQSLNLLLNKETVSFKCVDGYVKLTCEEIKELYDLVDQKIQSLFDLEMELYSKIDDFKVVSDFRSIEVDQ